MRKNLKTLTGAAIIAFSFAGASAHADALDDIK